MHNFYTYARISLILIFKQKQMSSIFGTNNESQDWENNDTNTTNSPPQDNSIFSDASKTNNHWKTEKKSFVSGIFWNKKDGNAPKNDFEEGDIFKEMWVEWLDFANIQNEKVKEGINPFQLWSIISSVLLWIIIFLAIWLYFNFYVKTTDSSYISSLPWICWYIWSSIDGYDNTSCKGLPSIIQDIQSKKDVLKNTIAQNLNKILADKIETGFVPATKEVKFILDKTNNRIALTDIFKNFKALLEKANWRMEVWKYKLMDYNYDCTWLKVSEKWDFDIKCSIYWDQLIWTDWISSRRIAINLLETINSDWIFILNKNPKSIDIAKFSSIDWIKSSFSTVTNLDLSLKFNNLTTNKK